MAYGTILYNFMLPSKNRLADYYLTTLPAPIYVAGIRILRVKQLFFKVIFSYTFSLF